MLRILTTAALLLIAGCSSHFNDFDVTLAGVPAKVEPTPPLVEQWNRAIATTHRVCGGESLWPGHAHCDAIVSQGLIVSPYENSGSSCLHQPGCYGPPDLQMAYGITQAAAQRGATQTVAIVDAFGYPGIESDLTSYRSFFRLPLCGSGCFQVVNQEGATSPLPSLGPAGDDWRPEQALDIDMVSAICPHCKIVLVQSRNDKTPNLFEAVKTALRMGDVVSLSWGFPEAASTVALFDSHPGKILTASAGDNGAESFPGTLEHRTQQPCSFAGVVCVGGTSLILNGGVRVREVVWDGLLTERLCSGEPCGTGSGCSSLVPKPTWQKTAATSGCRMRNATDVSAVSDPRTGVVISCTPCGYPCTPLCGGDGGTSAASPMIAAMFALAGNAPATDASRLWAHGSDDSFNDITQGTNQSAAAKTFLCPTRYAYICNARPGYDGPTGWGTPNGLTAF